MPDMEQPNEHGFTPLQEKEAEEAFHLQLGYTLSEWAAIEYVMFQWFWKLSNIPNGVTARRIFYSAKSFAGMHDMLKATIYSPNYDPDHPSKDTVCFVDKALKITNNYQTLRNKIAHSGVIRSLNKNTVSLFERGNINITGKDVVTIEYLRRGSENFKALKTIYWSVLLYDTPKKINGNSPLSPKEGFQQLKLLPRSADSNPPINGGWI